MRASFHLTALQVFEKPAHLQREVEKTGSGSPEAKSSSIKPTRQGDGGLKSVMPPNPSRGFLA